MLFDVVVMSWSDEPFSIAFVALTLLSTLNNGVESKQQFPEAQDNGGPHFASVCVAI